MLAEAGVTMLVISIVLMIVTQVFSRASDDLAVQNPVSTSYFYQIPNAAVGSPSAVGHAASLAIDNNTATYWSTGN